MSEKEIIPSDCHHMKSICINHIQIYFRNIPSYNIPDVSEFEAFPV